MTKRLRENEYEFDRAEFKRRNTNIIDDIRAPMDIVPQRTFRVGYRARRKGRASSSSYTYRGQSHHTYGRRKSNMKIPRFLMPESKVCDISVAPSVSITTTGLLTLLNALAQGTDYQQRIGRQVNWQSIQLIIRIDLPETIANQRPTSVRLNLVWDRQPNGATPLTSDIYREVDSGGTPAVRSISPLNLNNRKRFKILWDWKENFGQGSNQSAYFDMYRKLKGVTIFNGTLTATITVIDYGALYLFYQSDEGTTDNQPLITFHSRCRFTDP